MPFLLLISLSLLSSLFMGDGPFKLHRTDKFTHERRTADLGISYFVKSDFVENYGQQLGRIERQVEQEYTDQLRSQCYRERVNKEQRMWQARAYGDAAAYQKASQLGTPACDRLSQMYY